MKNKAFNYYFKFVGEDGCPKIVVRTDTGRLFDITGCRIFMDGEVLNRDGLIPTAIRISDNHVAELVAKSSKAKKKIRIRRLGLDSTLALVKAMKKGVV